MTAIEPRKRILVRDRRTIAERLGPQGVETVRHMAITGQTARAISDHVGTCTAEEIDVFLRGKRQQWLQDAVRQRMEDARRVIVFTKVNREGGGMDLRPVSLPRISMHVRALEEKAHV